MKNRTIIVALLISLTVGATIAILLFPVIYFWKIILLLIILLSVFIILNKLGGNFKSTPNLTDSNQFEIINHLLKNIEEENWGEKKQEFIILKKTNPNLAEQLLKVQNNYQANKQFTQNAAHELQTPLAIIKGHAELLLQASNLRESEANAIDAIMHNINRLSRLNSALILLSKIEQGRFNDEEPVRINEIVDATLEHFSDMIILQNIKIEKKYTDDFIINMSATLAEILIANLLQNAIRHNFPEGFIKIETNKNGLKISNPGKPLETSTENLFSRFYRESNKEESLGLGLSIVKRIAEQSGLKVGYEYLEGVHSVSIQQKS